MKNSLRYYRNKAGLTQETLAGKTPFSASTIGNVETGKTQASEVFWEEMGKALRIPCDQLRAPLIMTPAHPEMVRYKVPRSEDQETSVIREESPVTNWERRARTAEAKLEALTAAMESLLNQFRK